MTRIEDFSQRNAIHPADLARKARVSRQHLLRIRQGIADPTLPTMRRILRGAREISGTKVRMQMLFDLGDDDPPPESYHGVTMAKQRTSKEFDAFTKTMDQLLSVPKAEILRREA